MVLFRLFSHTGFSPLVTFPNWSLRASTGGLIITVSLALLAYAPGVNADTYISATMRFEKSLIRLSNQNQHHELADHIYYHSMRSGFVGEALYNAAVHLRATDPKGMRVLRQSLETALQQDRADPAIFLGSMRTSVLVMFDLVDKQLELERLLCSDTTRNLSREDPLFIEIAIKKSGLLVQDGKLIQYSPLVHTHVGQAKYWALERCARKLKATFPHHAASFQQVARRFYRKAKSDSLLTYN